MAGATEQNRLNEQRSASQQATSMEAVRRNNEAASATFNLPKIRGTESNGAMGQETGDDPEYNRQTDRCGISRQQ